MELVRRLNPSLSFPEAVAFLTGGPAPALASRPRQRPPERPQDAPAEPSGLPETDAMALVEAAATRLWNPEGTAALAYLHGRGLTDETIRSARLGWTPRESIPTEGRTGFFRASGVVIPWFASGWLTLAKLRQLDGRRPKYVHAFHNPARHEGIYPGPETIQFGRPLVIVEGEFDALCVGEALGELAAVVTLGSASARPCPGILGSMLAAAPWFIATDRDQAGDKAASEWPARSRRVRPPEPFKDWTDAKAGGVDLSRWWREILAGNDRPPLFTWDDLSRWRWGESQTIQPPAS